MKLKRLTITLLLVVLAAQSAFSGNTIRVMAQNLQNFFYILPVTGDNLPLSNYSDEAGRQAKMDAIMNAYFPTDGSIQPADIYCFCEIECSDDILDYIATNFKQKTGRNYTFVHDGLTKYGSDENDILRKSGFVYNQDVVKPYGANTATGVGMIYSRFMRMQTFEEIASGKRFTISMNHFKAGNKDDGEPTNAERRVENATQLLSALPTALDPDILIMGDLNSYIDEDCLQLLIGAGYEEQIFKYNPDIFYPRWGYGKIIDHAFANSTMAAQIKSANMYFVASNYALGDESPIAYSDHDPYMVEIELTDENPGYTFTKATEVKAGGQYLIAANLNGSLEVAQPATTTASKDYNYLYTQTVTEENGVITMGNLANAFTFEDAGNGQFYIKDSNDRYSAQTPNGSKWYTTMRVVSDKESAHKYTATKQADGTFKILSQTGYYIYGTIYNNTTPEFAFTNWATLTGSNCLPMLYEYTTVPTGINTTTTFSHPAAPRKVIENRRLIIVSPNGARHNLQGIRIK